MNQDILIWLMSNISFGALFVWLLSDTRKEAKEREKSLNDTIDKNQEMIKKAQDNISEYNDNLKEIINSLDIVKDIQEDVNDIKNLLK